MAVKTTVAKGKALELSTEQKSFLKDLEIKAGAETDVKKALLSYLKKADVEGVEDDSLDELISMAHDIWLVEDDNVESDPTDDEDDEDDEEPNVPADDDDGEEPSSFEDDDAPLGDKSEEDLVIGAAKETAEIRKSAKKNTTTAKPLEKKVVKHAGKAERFDSDVEAHVSMINKIFQKFFPAKQYELKILKRGITVYSLAQNSKITFVSFDDVKVLDGKTLWGNLFCNRFKDVEQLKAVLPEEIVSGHDIGFYASGSNVSIRGIDQIELIKILSDKVFMDENVKRLTQKDKQMGANFQRLKENTEKIDKSIPAKKAAKQAIAVEEADDDAEEDAVEEVPVKKTLPAKKVEVKTEAKKKPVAPVPATTKKK